MVYYPILAALTEYFGCPMAAGEFIMGPSFKEQIATDLGARWKEYDVSSRWASLFDRT